MTEKTPIELNASHLIDEASGTSCLPTVCFKILKGHQVGLGPMNSFPLYDQPLDGYIIGNSYDEIRIPEYVLINGEKYKVVELFHGVFWDSKFVKSLYIPKSIKKIASKIFKCRPDISFNYKNGKRTGRFIWTNHLSTIRVSEKNPIYDSRNNCNAIIETATNTLIRGCKNTVIPQSVEQISSNAFGDSDFTKIEIGSSIEEISSHGFWGCGFVESIKVDKANHIYDSRNGCNAIIESATNTLIRGCRLTIIPDDIKTIGANAFSHVFDLTEINIPDGVEFIGREAFHLCESLESIVIPASIKEIDFAAFTYCPSLKSVTVKNKDTVIHNSVFDDCRIIINDQALHYWKSPNSDYLDLNKE